MKDLDSKLCSFKSFKFKLLKCTRFWIRLIFDSKIINVCIVQLNTKRGFKMKSVKRSCGIIRSKLWNCLNYSMISSITPLVATDLSDLFWPRSLGPLTIISRTLKIDHYLSDLDQNLSDLRNWPISLGPLTIISRTFQIDQNLSDQWPKSLGPFWPLSLGPSIKKFRERLLIFFAYCD